MKTIARIVGLLLFSLLVVLLWGLSPYFPWREVCAEGGLFGFEAITIATDPFCSDDGFFGLERRDRSIGVVQSRLQGLGFAEFGVVVWGLLCFLILSLVQVVWSKISSLGGGEE